jgi:hypothetical protein
VSTIIIGASLNTHDGATTSTITQDKQVVARNAQHAPPSRMFLWNSQDACNLFSGTLERPSSKDDVSDALKLQIKLLHSVSNEHNKR